MTLRCDSSTRLGGGKYWAVDGQKYYLSFDEYKEASELWSATDRTGRWLMYRVTGKW